MRPAKYNRTTTCRSIVPKEHFVGGGKQQSHTHGAVYEYATARSTRGNGSLRGAISADPPKRPAEALVAVSLDIHDIRDAPQFQAVYLSLPTGHVVGARPHKNTTTTIIITRHHRTSAPAVLLAPSFPETLFSAWWGGNVAKKQTKTDSAVF